MGIVASVRQKVAKLFLSLASAPNPQKELSAPVESTSIPKAHLPFENVTAKLSNRLSFTGYLLDTLLLRRQNIACFALTEAERQVPFRSIY